MSDEKNFKFQVGDIVTAFGLKGKVISIKSSSLYNIIVDFEEGPQEAFSTDGKEMLWHKEPSLKLIERPKKKVKKYMVVHKRRYSNAYVSFNVSDDFYYNREDFENQHPYFEFICLLKESEIEVEEEEKERIDKK